MLQLRWSVCIQVVLPDAEIMPCPALQALCEQMGAVYTKELSAGNTHLICYEFKGQEPTPAPRASPASSLLPRITRDAWKQVVSLVMEAEIQEFVWPV